MKQILQIQWGHIVEMSLTPNQGCAFRELCTFVAEAKIKLSKIHCVNRASKVRGMH